MKREGWPPRQTRYQQEQARAARLEAGGESWERRRPARSASVQSDVFVPLAQAGVTALVAGIAAGAGAALLRLAHPVAIGALCAAGALGTAWMVLLRDHRRLLWEIETMSHRDLDGDGVVGEPQASTDDREDPRFVYVRDPAKQRRQERARDLHFWLAEAYGERGTTWRAWEGALLPSGREFTRPVWEEYNEQILRAGLATREYPTAALTLTSGYRDALGAFRELL